MLRSRRDIVIVFLALTAVVVAFAPDARAGASKGAGIVAEIGEPFEISGALYDAGTLRVRELRAFSPSTTLNEVMIDGSAVGMVLAASTSQSRPGSRHELVFARSPRGHLVLVAFAMHGESLRQLRGIGATNDSGRDVAAADSTMWLVADRQP